MKSTLVFILFVFIFSCELPEKTWEIQYGQFMHALSDELSKTDLPDEFRAAWLQNIQNENYQFLINDEAQYANVSKLISILEQAPDHGFREFFSKDLQRIQSSPIQNDSSLQAAIKLEQYLNMAKLEIQCRKACFAYSKAIEFGILIPDSVYSPFYFHTKVSQPNNSWYANQFTSPQIVDSLLSFHPKHPQYQVLQKKYKEALEDSKHSDFKELAVPKSALSIGNYYEDVALLRQKLHLPQLSDTLNKQTRIDKEISIAIKEFQKMHGLNPDGVLGKTTFDLLNASPKDILRKMEVNLERFRWKTDANFSDCILVNIPAYHLYVLEEGKVVQSNKVAVGLSTGGHQTPEFIDTLETVVVNPKWGVPRSIAVNEILPYAQIDPSYIEYIQYDLYNSKGKKISPYTVDFNKYTTTNFPFRLVQKSGDFNALGTLKFDFPNRYNIYIHDTPSYYIFDHEKRDVSHGCIRLHNPESLANYLFSKHSEEYQRARKQSATFTIRSPKQLQVNITYFTNWVDSAGMLQSRYDVYGRDKKIAEALDKYLSVH